MIVERTKIFNKWLNSLKDRNAEATIKKHIIRMENNNVGNVESVGGGVYEKKIDCGAGYRLYFCYAGNILILLLCGGDKSTQQRDISRAKRMKGDYL